MRENITYVTSYTCNIFSHWLRPCPTTDRKQVLVSSMLAQHHCNCSWSLLMSWLLASPGHLQSGIPYLFDLCGINWIGISLDTECRDHSVYGLTQLSQWERMLQCNIASHWLRPYTEWSLGLTCQITKTLRSISIRHRSNILPSDWCLIKADPRVFVIRNLGWSATRSPVWSCGVTYRWSGVEAAASMAQDQPHLWKKGNGMRYLIYRRMMYWT